VRAIVDFAGKKKKKKAHEGKWSVWILTSQKEKKKQGQTPTRLLGHQH